MPNNAEHPSLFPMATEGRATPVRRSAETAPLGSTSNAPLADRMRPTKLDEVVGQARWIGVRRPLRRDIEEDHLRSLILWGPPGSGKTTLARVIASHTSSAFVSLSAVLSGMTELRSEVAAARTRPRPTILFVDEIHRWNRAQQDGLLPHLEAGRLTLIGATTENPSFHLRPALLSRAQVIPLEQLSPDDITLLLNRAYRHPEGLDAKAAQLTPDAIRWLATVAGGDARRALGTLEQVVGWVGPRDEPVPLIELQDILKTLPAPHDRAGDSHYDLASALIKSLRDSDQDAAIYYLARLLEGGEDPMFVARRLAIFASEDIGLADPHAMVVASAAQQSTQLIGMPEALYPLSNATLYLARTRKSDAVKQAYMAAKASVETHGALPVPMRIRNAPTKLMKDLGHGKGYVNPRRLGRQSGREDNLPDRLKGKRFVPPDE